MKAKMWEVEESLLKIIFRQFTSEEQEVILRFNKRLGEEIRKDLHLQREIDEEMNYHKMMGDDIKCPVCQGKIVTEDNRADTDRGTYGSIIHYCEKCDVEIDEYGTVIKGE